MDIDGTYSSIGSAIIYSKEDCPYCVRAKRLLDDKGISYTEINAVEHRADLIQKVTEASGQPPKTVPQIFLDGEYVGGFVELNARLR